ncbi:hypothetical protein NHQ30_006874 [Ciborinia camelliae]|nr:hypothetical protein NHQ30_006874 [Ciborinia camelliae]
MAHLENIKTLNTFRETQATEIRALENHRERELNKKLALYESDLFQRVKQMILTDLLSMEAQTADSVGVKPEPHINLQPIPHSPDCAKMSKLLELEKSLQTSCADFDQQVDDTQEKLKKHEENIENIDEVLKKNKEKNDENITELASIQGRIKNLQNKVEEMAAEYRDGGGLVDSGRGDGDENGDEGIKAKES